MDIKISYKLFLFFLICPLVLFGQSSGEKIPVPSSAQLRWQHYEQTMFVCLDPCTWQGREYDNHSYPLNKINPVQLNTDQWCQVAKLWGAKLILFVAKHTGGFCWWQTETSKYGIKEIPWKNGKGDVLADLSKSCKKYGLDLGVYVYPGDEQWGAGIGSGGKTQDPSKQEAYNQLYREQLIEVLSRYGNIREVWFDGNCVVPVNDIIARYASDAVIFQGKSATIRWVGNEDGFAPYPNWYTLKKSDLENGDATALHSDVTGDVYAPVEVNAPLLNNNSHKWFWGPETDKFLLTLPQLMNMYYKSVGRGGVMLLNSTPDTTGLIPVSHVAVYKQFGDEIKARFSTPLKTTAGHGNVLEIGFSKPTSVNHVVIQEEIDKGQRVLQYVVEGLLQNKWLKLSEGTSIGNKKIDCFSTGEYSRLRVRFLKYKMMPQIVNFAAYNINSVVAETELTKLAATVGTWQADSYNSEWQNVTFELTSYMKAIGEYELYFKSLVRDYESKASSGLEFSDFKLEMYGREVPESIRQTTNGFWITRSQQTLDEFPIILRLKIRSKPAKTAGEILLRRITY